MLQVLSGCKGHGYLIRSCPSLSTVPRYPCPVTSTPSTNSALKRYVTEVRRAGPGAISFFYYSGHGVANPETQINYLIPIDVADADDDKVWFESLQQNNVINLLSKQAPNATHYVVFDASRNDDVGLIETSLKHLGFEITLLKDANYKALVADQQGETRGLLRFYGPTEGEDKKERHHR